MKTPYTFGLAAISFLCFATITGLSSNNGIHTHPSGEAVFIEGDACVVNTHENLTYAEIENMLDWCKIQTANDFLRPSRYSLYKGEYLLKL